MSPPHQPSLCVRQRWQEAHAMGLWFGAQAPFLVNSWPWLVGIFIQPQGHCRQD